MHIVLDIDGTLIDQKTQVFRPYIEEFLDYCFTKFETVNIWTAASYGWYTEVLSKLKPILRGRTFSKVYYNEQCTLRHVYHEGTMAWCKIKVLKKMCKGAMTLDNTVIVDDTPLTFCRNYGNAVYIMTYNSESNRIRNLSVSQ